MKKGFIFTLLMSVILFCSCNSCQKKSTEPIQNDSVLVVENIISMDRDTMFNQHGDDYRWYETYVVLDNFLDEENEGKIGEVINVFQTVVNRADGYDTQVYKIQHFKNDSTVMDSVKGFWVEDFPLNIKDIKVPFDSAFNLVMQANLPKPHSRYCVLRKEIGPNVINPQYIFGNNKAQIYVDATTGKVTDKNPAFPENTKLSKIDIEWP